MISKAALDVGSEAALITGAFIVRNSVVLIGLSTFALIALAR